MGKRRKEPSTILRLPGDFCALCLLPGKPCMSHILAGHMGRWMKERSASKKFRQGNSPNRTVRDLPRIPLLCEKCELLIKRYEDQFKAEVWDPYCIKLEAAGGELPDDVPPPDAHWMQMHTLSIAWRALHVGEGDNERRLELTKLAKAANDVWRPALLAGKLPDPTRSDFWVIQSKKMDELLKRRGHVGNRLFITMKAYLGNSDESMGWRGMQVEVHRLPIGGGIAQFEKRIYDLKTRETGRGWYMSFVKGYGTCFMGIHIDDPAVAEAATSEMESTVRDHLDNAWKENERRIESRLSPEQRAQDAADKEKYEKNPTLSMKLIAGDERERAAKLKPKG